MLKRGATLFIASRFFSFVMSDAVAPKTLLVNFCALTESTDAFLSLRTLIVRNDLKTLGIALVQFLVAAAVGPLLVGLYFFSLTHPMAIENWIEIGQEVCVLVAAVLFARSAMKEPELAGGLWLISGFFTAIFIRELDAWFDVINHGSWKRVLSVYLILLLIQLWRVRFKTIIPGLVAFVKSRAYLMMLPGLAIVLSYSRLMGYKGVWLNIMGDYARWRAMKDFTEESTELVGYVLIMGASLFWYWRQERLNKAQGSSDNSNSCAKTSKR